jgi:hypothetical protein
MAQLAALEVKTLKVDRSFVMNMPPGGKNEAIVRSTITLAKRLRLRTVAEGVEDEPTARRLFDMGCEVGQGYLWSRPLAPGAFGDWLSAYEPVPFRPGGSAAALALAPGNRLRRHPVEATESEEVLRASLSVGNACAQATTREEVVAALQQMVLRLGGSVVGDDEVLGPDVIDIDLSLGAGVGLYPTAPSDSLQRHSIEQALRLSIPGATATAARLQLALSV